MTKPTKWRVRPAKTKISLGIRSFRCPYLPIERTAKSLIRLIWVFAGRTCHFVGFVMRRLKCVCSWAAVVNATWPTPSDRSFNRTVHPKELKMSSLNPCTTIIIWIIQWKRGSAVVSAQSDERLCCSLPKQYARPRITLSDIPRLLLAPVAEQADLRLTPMRRLKGEGNLKVYCAWK